MTPVKLIRCKILFPVWLCTGILLSVLHGTAQSTKNSSYQLKIQFVDKDNSFTPQALKLQTGFANKLACDSYIQTLPTLLSSIGYPTASVDSILENEHSTTIYL